jgi:hypothetical protein
MRQTDTDLLFLARYLVAVADRPSLSDLKHDEWKDMLKKK